MSSLIEEKYYPPAIDPVREIVEKFCATCPHGVCLEKKCFYYNFVLWDKEMTMASTGQLWNYTQ
jgi:hypothetical protein